jgi:uncharacterized protein (DUF1778 family)
MARPLKDKNLLMKKSVRIMLTDEQRSLLDGAALAAGLDISAWARSVLLAEAKRIAPANPPSKRKRGEKG